MFFHNWETIGRIALSAAFVYVFMIIALRLVGEQALAQMSGYDLVITFALGSLLAAIPLTTAITVSDGFTAIVTFLVLQEGTRFLQKRSRLVHHLVRKRPVVVVWDGTLLQDRLHSISITDDEVRGAVRRAGYLSMHDVQIVVLENDGDWSVIGRSEIGDLSALEGLELPYLVKPGGEPGTWIRQDPV